MKALSLTQPWATLVAIGAKKVETRSWHTSHDGLIAIHASKGYPKWARETCAEEPFYSVLNEYGRTWDAAHPGGRGMVEDPLMPIGAIVALARIDQVLPTGAIDLQYIGAQEQAFGDYASGRYGWFLEDVRKLARPIECRGALGLWQVPADVEALVLQAVPR